MEYGLSVVAARSHAHGVVHLPQMAPMLSHRGCSRRRSEDMSRRNTCTRSSRPGPRPSPEASRYRYTSHIGIQCLQGLTSTARSETPHSEQHKRLDVCSFQQSTSFPGAVRLQTVYLPQQVPGILGPVVVWVRFYPHESLLFNWEEDGLGLASLLRSPWPRNSLWRRRRDKARLEQQGPGGWQRIIIMLTLDLLHLPEQPATATCTNLSFYDWIHFASVANVSQHNGPRHPTGRGGARWGASSRVHQSSLGAEAKKLSKPLGLIPKA
jgi:hypothetical protein